MKDWIWVKADNELIAYINVNSVDAVFSYASGPGTGIVGSQMLLRNGEKVFSPLTIDETYNALKNKTNISGPMRYFDGAD